MYSSSSGRGDRGGSNNNIGRYSRSPSASSYSNSNTNTNTNNNQNSMNGRWNPKNNNTSNQGYDMSKKNYYYLLSKIHINIYYILFMNSSSYIFILSSFFLIFLFFPTKNMIIQVKVY